MAKVHRVRSAGSLGGECRAKNVENMECEKEYPTITYTFENFDKKFRENLTKFSDILKERDENGKGDPVLSGIKINFESLAEVEFLQLQKQFEHFKSNRPENDLQVKELEEKIQRLEKELAEAQSKIDMLEKENQQLNSRVTVLEQIAQKDSVTIAFLGLGQLCTDIQKAMYKHVLPDLYNPYTSYKIPQILDDMKDLPSESRSAAENRWKMLQSRLNWNKDLERALRNLSQSRNQEAHPTPVDGNTLSDYVSVLDRAKYFIGSPSREDVKRLIAIRELLC